MQRIKSYPKHTYNIVSIPYQLIFCVKKQIVLKVFGPSLNGLATIYGQPSIRGGLASAESTYIYTYPESR